jgi:hypothetical protein
VRPVSLILFVCFGRVGGCRRWCNRSRQINGCHVAADGNGLDGRDKPVTAARESFYKSRVVGRVAKSLTKSFYSCVKAVFKINEGISGPEFPVKLLARNQLTGVFEETDQNLDRLPFQADFATLLLEFTRAQIEFEDPEPDQARGWCHWSHWKLKIATVPSLPPVPQRSMSPKPKSTNASIVYDATPK